MATPPGSPTLKSTDAGSCPEGWSSLTESPELVGAEWEHKTHEWHKASAGTWTAATEVKSDLARLVKEVQTLADIQPRLSDPFRLPLSDPPVQYSPAEVAIFCKTAQIQNILNHVKACVNGLQDQKLREVRIASDIIVHAKTARLPPKIYT
jgi:hypothetical protein